MASGTFEGLESSCVLVLVWLCSSNDSPHRLHVVASAHEMSPHFVHFWLFIMRFSGFEAPAGKGEVFGGYYDTPGVGTINYSNAVRLLPRCFSHKKAHKGTKEFDELHFFCAFCAFCG